MIETAYITSSNPIPLFSFPLEGEKYDFTLPFKGRAGVGMGSAGSPITQIMCSLF
jgi:hypothetical protein